MDGAGNDAIKLVYERACEIFDVQNTFVMYPYPTSLGKANA